MAVGTELADTLTPRLAVEVVYHALVALAVLRTAPAKYTVTVHALHTEAGDAVAGVVLRAELAVVEEVVVGETDVWSVCSDIPVCRNSDR